MRLIPLLPLCVVFLFAIYLKSAAQKQNNVWYFGYKAGLDFNTDPPTPIEGAIEAFEGCASISDSLGNLLFYTNGEKAWDRNHNLMPNGTGLLGGYSSTQEALIVPLPNSCSKYYLFTAEDQFSDGGIAYSIIDMRLNNGYGDIISSTKNTLVVNKTTEKLTAVLHTNKVDVWIITHTLKSNDFIAYLLTDSGLNMPPVISSIGAFYDTIYYYYGGYFRPSHDGSKIVAAVPRDICEMFDFNATTGELTNLFSINQLLPNKEIYGVEFSLNDSLLYLTNNAYHENAVFQLNLNPSSLQITTLITYDPGPGRFGALQMGPNGKIYLGRYYVDYLDVIHHPDKPGIDCQYEIAGITLLPGTASVYGLPNPAPYSFCPTLSLGQDRTFCIGDSVQLTITLNSTKDCPQSFVWYDGTEDHEKILTQTGIYWIEVNTTCGTYRDSMQVRVDSMVHTALTISVCQGGSHEGYTESGTYIDTFSTIAGCDSFRTLILTVNPVTPFILERTICVGSSFDGYTQSGIYKDTFELESGCDSIRILRLNVISCLPIIKYDLDACESVMDNGSHMDYTEFIPAFPSTLACASVEADYLFRSPPQENKHSCTPGISGSPAMCVTTLNSCEYQAGNAASVVIEFSINPAVDSVVQFALFEFYEKGPATYSWINGPSGPNDYPIYYGIRILKNGTEIYRENDIHTSLSWGLQIFDFIDREEFRVEGVTDFRIELLPYCPVGNGAAVSAWDLDEFKIYAGCVSPLAENPIIDGNVFTKEGLGISNAWIHLAENPSFTVYQSHKTNETGYYVFDPLEPGKSYYLKGYKNDDVLNGVSTLDLIKIQKHLLGIEPFTTIDQYVAADVNRNGNISVIDLLDLRKLLLGKYNEFPRNTSWRFGALPQDFTGIDLSTFQEIKTIETLDKDHQEVNFLGIKIGDLNGDAILNNTESKIATRSKSSITLLIEDQKIFDGQPIMVPVSSGNYVNMEGLQLTFDIRNFNLQTINSGILLITGENFLVDDNGILRMSWTEIGSVSVRPGNILFTLVLVPKVSGLLRNQFQLANDYLLPQCYSPDDRNPIGLELKVVNQTVLQVVSPIFQIEPNPLQSTFNLRFYLDYGGRVVFRFYDGTGKQCHVVEKFYLQGEHIESIDFNAFPGVICCQMISNGNTCIQKAIKVN